MPENNDKRRDERDEPVKIDLDPEEALKALLKVDPKAKPVDLPAADEKCKDG